MEARIARAALMLAAFISLGADYRTPNFLVSARSPQFAKQVGDLAEQYRRELAIEWLGRELPRWQDIVPITVDAAPSLGAGGATSFMFDRGRAFGWKMSVQGSQERILDSVLPHEVTHTIFATHFGGPLPRWADEGACTTVEHPSERAKQQKLLLEFLATNRGIPFNRMFEMTEYPHDILPLYSQGHSLAQYLLNQGGKHKFIEFVGRGMNTNNWDQTVMDFYGYRDLSDLQLTWIEWVRDGSPAEVAPRQQLASRSGRDTTSNQLAGRNAQSQQAVELARGLPPRQLVPVPSPSERESLAGLEIASRPATSQGSWYARQREVARQTQPPSGTPMQSTSRPPATQRVQEQVLEWNSRARIPVKDQYPAQQQALARGPVYFDAPASGGTAMRR